MKDVGMPPKKKIESPSRTESQSTKPEAKKGVSAVTEKENKVTITQIFEFAGEEVRYVSRQHAALGSVLNHIRSYFFFQE